MQTDLEKQVVQTLIYADIFDYPLTTDEIHQYLIAEDSRKLRIHSYDAKKDLATVLSNLPFVWKSENLYSLRKKGSLAQVKKEREKESRKKIDTAKRISYFLSNIPTLRFIGISGAVAMNNAKRSDDIDLFLIVQKKKLWITRLFVLLMLELLGKRRGRKTKETKNSICVNMIIDDVHLTLPRDRQDLYTAHEIVQMRPILEKNDIYSRFVQSNLWVKKYLPNAIDTKILRYKDIKGKEAKFPNILISEFLNIFEFLAKPVQLWYIGRHKTTETVSDGFVAFHPFEYRTYVLREYKERLKSYGIE